MKKLIISVMLVALCVFASACSTSKTPDKQTTTTTSTTKAQTTALTTTTTTTKPTTTAKPIADKSYTGETYQTVVSNDGVDAFWTAFSKQKDLVDFYTKKGVELDKSYFYNTTPTDVKQNTDIQIFEYDSFDESDKYTYCDAYAFVDSKVYCLTRNISSYDGMLSAVSIDVDSDGANDVVFTTNENLLVERTSILCFNAKTKKITTIYQAKATEPIVSTVNYFILQKSNKPNTLLVYNSTWISQEKAFNGKRFYNYEMTDKVGEVVVNGNIKFNPISTDIDYGDDIIPAQNIGEIYEQKSSKSGVADFYKVFKTSEYFKKGDKQELFYNITTDDVAKNTNVKVFIKDAKGEQSNSYYVFANNKICLEFNNYHALGMIVCDYRLDSNKDILFVEEIHHSGVYNTSSIVIYNPKSNKIVAEETFSGAKLETATPCIVPVATDDINTIVLFRYCTYKNRFAHNVKLQLLSRSRKVTFTKDGMKIEQYLAK